MNTESSVTETVVRNHLQAFLEQKGIAAILNDYDENARFYSETKIYQGKQEESKAPKRHQQQVPKGALAYCFLLDAAQKHERGERFLARSGATHEVNQHRHSRCEGAKQKYRS